MGFVPFAEQPADQARPRRQVVYRGDAHLMCIAPTGAGKGPGLIIPNLLHYPGPVIVTDPKGVNYLVTSRRRREMGHRVIALDPFGVATDKSDRLNPFDLLLLPGSQPDADAELLADLLTGGEPTTTKEPFWDLTSGGLLIQAFGVTNGLMAAECAAVLGCKSRDLLRLRPDQQMVLMPRRTARMIGRIDYLRDRCFRGLFTPNPRHASAERGL
jgi:type IV secretory pathway TraG/TraD family ATPase VirD4